MSAPRIPAWAWLAYRRTRVVLFSVAGRNPIATAPHALPLRVEWNAVRALRESLKHPPVAIGRDAEGRTLWQTAAGQFWTPPGAGGHYVGQLAGEMKAGVYDLSRLDRLGRPGVVFDCGANVGFFTRLAIEHGASRVVCFEPSPENAGCLRKNLETEIRRGCVDVVEKGVWDSEAVLSFSTNNVSNPGGHHLTLDDSGGTRVEVTSIERVAGELGIDHVDYIKMDVEAAEVRALLGARDLIRRCRPVLCIATEHTDDLFANARAVIDTVRSIDPEYKYMWTEAHPYRSPSRGLVLTPYSLLFYH